MSVKSLPIAEWSNAIVIESIVHWWKPLDLQYYELGEAVYCFFQSLLVLWVKGYYGRTHKEKTDDYRPEQSNRQQRKS